MAVIANLETKHIEEFAEQVWGNRGQVGLGERNEVEEVVGAPGSFGWVRLQRFQFGPFLGTVVLKLVETLADHVEQVAVGVVVGFEGADESPRPFVDVLERAFQACLRLVPLPFGRLVADLEVGFEE